MSSIPSVNRSISWLLSSSAVIVLPGLLLSLSACTKPGPAAAEPVTLLNVSYDPTRELYEDFNAAFAKHWEATRRREDLHQAVPRRLGQAGARGHRRAGRGRRHARARVRRRHAPRQGRASCRRTGRSGCRTTARRTPPPSSSWCARATRRTSTTGRTWPSPAWPSSPPTRRRRAARGGTTWPPGATRCARPAVTRPRRSEFVAALFKNVPVLDSGARGSTTTFAERGIGDVLIAWENEALLLDATRSARTSSRSSCRRVSILAEPPVTLVDKNVDRKGTRAAAEAYLQFLYSEEGQEIAAKHHYRPRSRGRGREVRQPLPHRAASSPSTRSSAAGARRRRRTSTTAACSTSIYAPKAQSAGTPDHGIERARRVLPGFGLTLGLSWLYLGLLVLAAAVRPLPEDVHPDVGAVLGDGGLAARARRLPAQLRRLRCGGAGQCRLRAARGLGAGPLPLPGQAPGRRAGGPAVRAAHGRRGHRR